MNPSISVPRPERSPFFSEHAGEEGLLALGAQGEAVPFALFVGVLMTVLVATSLVLVWITRQWRSTAARLTRSISTLHATFGSISDGVLVIRGDNVVAGYNQQFLDLWSIPKSVAETRQDDVLLLYVMDQLKEPERYMARVRELYATPQLSTAGEIVEFKDGRVFERDSRPLLEGSQVKGRVWSFRDITARRRAEEEKMRLTSELAQTHKMEAIGNLAGGIAHDFNNILVGIIGYAELARARLPVGHPACDDLQNALNAASRARDLVKQILTFSRKRPAQKEVLSMEPIVRDALKLLRATIPAAIQIRAELHFDLRNVLADPTQIHQAILNLATNAAQAIGAAPGEILIGLGPAELSSALLQQHPALIEGEWICLRVADTGCGIRKEALQHLFEPFFTAKNTGDGTGIGLAVVQRVVEDHHGIIAVESEEGRGTTFRIFLPAVAAQPSSQTLHPTQITPRGEGEHILVVDDEGMVCDVARTFLEELGYKVSTEQSPEHALATIIHAPTSFHLLLTDLNMPRLNGMELIRKAKAAVPALHCMIFTGFVGSVATENEAQNLGVREILNKPFTRHTLAVAVSRVLKTTQRASVVA